jgi:2-isopropylmalate synthase
MSEPHVLLFDTTLRDGEQAPGFSMRLDEKLLLARQLDLLGVDIIEAGFPIASADDAEAVRRIGQEIRRPVIAALSRTADKDIDCAGEALRTAARPRIHTFIATSDLHMAVKLRMSREDVLATAVSAVKRARNYTDDVEFSAEDATRSDLDFLCQVVEAVIAAGATTVNLPDTVGYAMPEDLFEFFTTIRTRVPNADKTTFSAHNHDDLGLAVANSLAAVKAGVRQIECTINGIGERAGNASLEEIAMIAKVRGDRAGFTTSVNTREIFRSSQLLSQLTGENVQANKAIVGRNAFAHEAGIHQDGMLKDRRTYEIMSPQEVGAPQSTMVLGKHSGRHAVQKRCEELGIAMNRREVDQVYRQMVALADRQKHISDQDLLAIVATVHESEALRQGIQGLTQLPGSSEPAAASGKGYGHGV